MITQMSLKDFSKNTELIRSSLSSLSSFLACISKAIYEHYELNEDIIIYK